MVLYERPGGSALASGNGQGVIAVPERSRMESGSDRATRASPEIRIRAKPMAKARPLQPAEPEERAGDGAGAAWQLDLTDAERAYLNRALKVLTAREREVLYAICAGGTNEGIADRLCIALPTLRTHLMRLNQKLGTTSKGDVVRYVSACVLGGYRTSRIALSGDGRSTG